MNRMTMYTTVIVLESEIIKSNDVIFMYVMNFTSSLLRSLAMFGTMYYILSY
jgi:hypothetical protein